MSKKKTQGEAPPKERVVTDPDDAPGELGLSERVDLASKQD